MRATPYRLSALFATAVLLVVAVPATATTASETYTGGLTGPTAFNTGCDLPAPLLPTNTGGACFDVPAGADRVDVTLEDEVSRDVAAWVLIEDASGDNLDNDFICNEGGLGLSDDAATVSVYIESAVATGTSTCLLHGGGPTAPTQGTITAAFR